MKKIFFSIVALAALAACSKSEVAYETSAEIGFAPVKGNVTKASGMSGNLVNTQELGVWAFWNKTVDLGTESSVAVPQDGYAAYNDNYLVNALFASKSGSWGGSPTGYPWPVNGALVFAGYTTPGDEVLTTGTAVEYALATDIMTFKNYANVNEFDLCWFGRTDKSYNNRTSGDAVTVELSHTLTWVTIAAYAQNSAIGWKITSMTLNNYNVAGTATCNGSTKKAIWDPVTKNGSPLTIGNTAKIPHTLVAADSGKGVVLSDNVLIPSDAVELTVNFCFDVNGVTKNDSKTFVLNAVPWESGVHYTYTLVFNSTEILLAPKYEEWGVSDDNTITVE